MGQAENYLQKLTTAAAEKNPLKMAVISYNAFRDSPLAIIVKENHREEYDALALDAIERMAIILGEKMDWEEELVEEFLLKSKELADLE